MAYVTSHMYHSGKYSIMASSESDKTRICFATSFVVQWLRHPIPTHGTACSRPGHRKTFCECISLLKHLVLYQRLVECLYSVCLRSYSLHCCLFIYNKYRHGIVAYVTSHMYHSGKYSMYGKLER